MINNLNLQGITPYLDVNEILLNISKSNKDILSKNLIGLYLFGSLTYGAFDSYRSDIDLVTIINKPLNQRELDN